MIGAGATSGGAMDASNLLKPALQIGALRCIGSTTYKEYRNYFEKDRALVRRFQKIDVNEPSVEDAVKILRGLKPYYEKHHKVRYTAEAIRAAVELSARYINDRKLPDKAIDVIDEVGAAQMLLPESQRKKTITVKDVEAIVAKIARIPPRAFRTDDRTVLNNLERDLKTHGVRPGQGDRRAGQRHQAGARRPARAGEADRQLSVLRPDRRRQDRGGAAARPQPGHRADPLRHVRIHGAAHRLAPDRRAAGLCRLRPGRPADRRDRPASACVLLLDEIEKAHPDLFNILLQVMDHGKLTDHNGKTIDFRNVILIMTTNAGAADMAKPAIGFGREVREGEDKEAINRMFTPEFRNRLDAIISFANLTPEVVGRVVDKFVMQLEAQLADRHVTIELTDAAREWLAKKGYDPLYGARPLARVIQEHIKKPLAEELLFGKLEKGGVVRVDVKDGKLDFSYPAPRLPAPRDDGGKKEPELVER